MSNSEFQKYNVTPSDEINKSIVGLNPEMEDMDEDTLRHLGKLLLVYFFQNSSDVEEEIKNLTNEITIEFIEGIKIIIDEQEIKSIEKLQEYLEYQKSSINLQDLCQPCNKKQEGIKQEQENSESKNSSGNTDKPIILN